jgi:predicted DNA-binding ribbon-helix-helix protein
VREPVGRVDGRIEKRSVRIAGHRTSVSLEPAFWAALKAAAARRGLSLNRLIEAIDRERTAAPHPGNLSSAVRVFVLAEVQGAAPPAPPAGNDAAPHGPIT